MPPGGGERRNDMGINSVSVTGNLTRDPELKATAGGSSVLSMGVAVNERRKDPATGEWGDYPNFVDCVVFGNRAEALARILAKGAKVAVHGRLRQDRWQDQDGRNRSRIEVVADEVDLMQRSGEARAASPSPAAAQSQPTPAPAAAAAPAATAAPADDLYASDIPF